MEYERIHKARLPRQHSDASSPICPFQSGGFSPAKLRAMLLGLEKHHTGEEAAPEAEDSGKLDDRKVSLECSTSTGMSSNRSRTRATDDDDSFDSESISSGPPAQRPVAATFLPPFSRPPPSKWDDAEKWISSPTANRAGRPGNGGGLVPKKSALASAGHGLQPPPVTKVAVDVPIKGSTVLDSGVKAAVFAKNSVDLIQYDSLKPVQSASIVDQPATAVRSVSMRDTGTEMTPIASQEPSRTGTPIIALSPRNSRTPTPQRAANGTSLELSNCSTGSDKKEMSEGELQVKTRSEIAALGQRLGKANIAAWASKDGEEASGNPTNATVDRPTEVERETHAAEWEEAEKAKYLARFEREEVKIQVWENQQKAKIETQMKKIEAEMERKRAREQERLASKLAAARRRAEEKRAAAEARRNQDAARTAEQAQQIRRTGRVPSSLLSCWCWCI